MYTESLVEYYQAQDDHDPDIEDMIADELKKLPEQIRKVIELKYFKKKKIVEISNVLNIAPTTVKTQLKRGKLKL